MTILSDSGERFGPLLLGDGGGVRFQLWAPGARRVELVLPEPDRRLSMERQGDEDFFCCEVADAGPGTRYLYSRNGGKPLPDPASRWQPDGVDGPSEVIELTRPATPPFVGRPPEELVIYELHVGAFSDAGTYDGVVERLEHLHSLGVTCLELMPLATFAGRRNWGYDGVFHFAPHPSYGPPAALQRLIADCHRRGISVILDLVTNHFGSRGNAMWTLAPKFFRPDRPTAWSAGINWGAEPVLRYFDEVVRVWQRDYDVDGFRFDAFHAIPAAARKTHIDRMVRQMRELRADNDRSTLALLESPANQYSLLGAVGPVQTAQLNFDFQRSMHPLLTGESHGEYADYAEQPTLELARCAERGFCFNERHSSLYGRLVGEPATDVSWDAIVNFLQNHDTVGNRYRGQRLDGLADEPRLAAATAFLLLHPAVPFLFMGQEWGATTPFYFFIDPDGDEAFGRRVERCRKRLFRELGKNETASDASVPGAAAIEAFERSKLAWDELDEPRHRAFLRFVTELLQVRRRYVGLMSRHSQDVRTCATQRAVATTIQSRGETLASLPFLLVVNFGDEPLPLVGAEAVLHTTALQSNARQVGAATTELRRLSSQTELLRID